MVRKVFYSFHYKPDCFRVSQVRQIGVIEGNQAVRDNDWETITRGGDAAIKRWVGSQLFGKSCTIVLIGSQTAGRKWINYEICESWNSKMGIFGINIHNLKDTNSSQSFKGSNPFSQIPLSNSFQTLASIVKVYDPPFNDSKAVYKYIGDNIGYWTEEAINIRANH